MDTAEGGAVRIAMTLGGVGEQPGELRAVVAEILETLATLGRAHREREKFTLQEAFEQRPPSCSFSCS